jgi:hypothetical protein
MDFIVVISGIILLGGFIGFIIDKVLDEKSKLFQRLEKLF